MSRLFLLLLLSGSAMAADLRKEVVLWHAYRGAEKAALEKVAALFNESASFRAVPVALPHDGFADRIGTAIPKGEGPDLFIYAQDRLGGWVESGDVVKPLDTIESPAPGYWDLMLGRFLETTREAVTYRGTVYGLPLGFKVLVMVHNRKLLPIPPRTTEQLAKAARLRTRPATGTYGLAYSYTSFYYHAALLNAFLPEGRGAVFDADRKPSLNTAAHVESFELVLRWLGTDRILPPDPSPALVKSLFNAGKAAVVLEGPWFLGEISPTIDYGLAPLPAVSEAGGRPMRPWITTEGIFISARSTRPKEALELAKFLAGVQAGKVLALEGRQCPANKRVYDDREVAADAALRLFYQQARGAVAMPNDARMGAVGGPADAALQKIFSRAESPRKALDALQKTLDEGAGASRPPTLREPSHAKPGR